MSSLKLRKLKARAKKLRARRGWKFQIPRFSLRYPQLPGYSMEKILLVGLSLPGFVMAGLLLGFYIPISFGLSKALTFLLSVVGTFAGFGCGTFVLVRLSSRITNFAKIKKER